MPGIDDILKEIEERAEKASEGPWDVELDPDDQDSCWGVVKRTPHDNVVIIETDMGYYDPDVPTAAFIAHARTDVPRLCRALRYACAFLGNDLDPQGRLKKKDIQAILTGKE